MGPVLWRVNHPLRYYIWERLFGTTSWYLHVKASRAGLMRKTLLLLRSFVHFCSPSKCLELIILKGSRNSFHLWLCKKKSVHRHSVHIFKISKLWKYFFGCCFFVTNQFRLLAVHSHYDVFVKCWQQMTDSLIFDRKLFFTLVVLTII